MSQSDLEQRSGILERRACPDTRTGTRTGTPPSIQTLERLAEALGVSQAFLLGEEPGGLSELACVLAERGVRIETPELGADLAQTLADMLHSLGGGLDEPHSEGDATRA
jgi:transcriptional regulator with XRE-family HTH domain